MKKLTLLIFSIIAYHSYSNTIDTLYYKNRIDQIKITFLTDQDSAMLQLQILANECEKIDYTRGYADCIGQMGIFQKQIGNFTEALDLFNKALNIYEELNLEYGIAALKLSIGAVYSHLSAYSLALEYIHESLEFFEAYDKTLALGGAYMTLSGIYINIKEYDLGLDYIDKAIKQYEKLEEKYGICGCKLNKAIILHEQKRYRECISEFQDVISLAKDINSDNYLADSYVYVGSSYLKLGNLEKAEEYLLKIPEMSLVNSQVLLEAYLYISDLYKQKKNYDKAIFYIQKLVEESTKLELIGNKMKGYHQLALYYSETGNHKKAYEYQELAYQLKDSIFDSEKTSQMQKLETIYQTEKKQQKIENLENENKIQQLKLQKANITYSGIIVILFVISGGLILAVRNSRLRVKNENIKLEQKLLRSQMNPHFIFNAISAIQHYIVKNRSLEASSYLSSFAKLMRSILQNSREELVSLETEFQTLEDYLNLQKLRLDGKLTYTIHGKENFDTEDIAIPPMLLQPFIENAIEHGIMKKEEQKGTIDITFKEEKNSLYIEIVDDGIGRKSALKKINKDHKSFATEITNQRIKSIKKSYNREILFDIIDLKNNNDHPTGTKVIFKLPLLSA